MQISQYQNQYLFDMQYSVFFTDQYFPGSVSLQNEESEIVLRHPPSPHSLSDIYMKGNVI